MSCKRPVSVMLITLILAFLLTVLPACAANTTPTTTTAMPETNVSVTQTPVAANQTTVPTTTQTDVTASQTTVPATTGTVVTTNQTTVPPTIQTSSPVPQTPANATTPKPATPATTAVTTGAVTVYSSPAGASILIDSVYCGTTPKTVQGVPAGNHILRLTLSGYQDYEGSIYVMAGQTVQGYGTLQPISVGASAAPSATVTVPVVVPVATTRSTDDSGILGNSSILVAVIGAISVIVASAATIFTHIRPPRKE